MSWPRTRSASHSVCLRLPWLALSWGLLLGVSCGEPQRPTSLILVSLDTLRADRLGAYGNLRQITPNLDRFAHQAVVFDNAYSQSNETLFSHASLFSGRYPSELGQLTYEYLPSHQHPFLAEILSAYGYRCGASVAGGHLSPEFGFDRGFESYVNAREWGSLFHTLPPALDWLDRLDQEQPFFLFLHTYDAHQRYLKPTPFGYSWADMQHEGSASAAVVAVTGTNSIFSNHYFPPENAQVTLDFSQLHIWDQAARSRIERLALDPGLAAQPFDSADTDYVRGVYDGAVSYLDALFGIFLDSLDARGMLDNTIIAVVSDHGESLGEQGLFNHRYTLFDTDLHVPMMIRLPGGKGGGRHVQQPVGLIDLLPTLLDLLEVAPPAGAQGRSLVPLLSGRQVGQQETVFSESAFRMISARSPEHRVTFTGMAADSPFLSDLLASTPCDGPAFQDSDTEDLSIREDLRRQMLDWRRALSPPPQVQQQVDPRLLRALQERGYWGL